MAEIVLQIASFGLHVQRVREGITGSARDFPCFLKRHTNSFTALQTLWGYFESFEILGEFFDTSYYFNGFICIFSYNKL